MTWTDALSEPLATAARHGSWSRVEPARGEGWLFLASGSDDTDATWFRLRPGDRTPRRLSILRDRRIRGLRDACRTWQERGARVDLLAWRPGRRAVFRVLDATGVRICKLYRRADGIVDRWRAFTPKAGSWSAPRVIGWDEESRMLSIEVCPGRSLHARWFAGEGRAEDATHLVELLAQLNSSPAPRGVPPHDVDEEIRGLDRRLEIVGRAVAAPGAGLTESRNAVVHALREIVPGRRVLCHRDLHDKQILIGSDRGFLIDFDLAVAGPPGLDAGNLLAQVRLRHLQGAPIPWREIVSRLISETSQLDFGSGLRAWTAAALLRLALLYRLRRRPAGLVTKLLSSTDDALRSTGEWSGLR